MSNLIEIKNLTKKLGDFSLKEVSFSLPRGYIMGFVGPNGAGKSTTIKLMLNLLKKDGGEIKLFGLDNIENELEVKQRIGFVLDENSFFENIRVDQVGWMASGIYEKWSDEKFQSYLHQFQLPPKKKAKELSTGMKAKLSIAIALSHDAELLILDEPTSGLDPVVRQDILNELFKVVEDSNRGVFFSTHITSDLDKVADYITFIKNGEIILSISKDEIDENYSIVKGTKKQLEEVSEYLLKVKTTPFGFEGLSDKSLILKKKYKDQLVIEKATIEDMMLYFEKGEKI